MGLVTEGQVIAGDQKHELGIHIHTVEAVVHTVKVRGKEMGHSAVLPLVGGGHTHLPFLQCGKEGGEGVGGVVGDIGGGKAAVSEPLPKSEKTVLQPPGILHKGGKVA